MKLSGAGLGLLLSLSLCSGSGYAISRVGNRAIGDSSGRVRMEVGNEFSRIEPRGDGFVQLYGFGIVRPQLVDVGGFDVHYPEFGRLGRSELRARLGGSGWSSLPHTNRCVDAFEAQSGDTLTLILTWGEGKGLVFAGPTALRAALQRLIATLTLAPEECAWFPQ